MSTSELRRNAKKTIDELSGPSLRFVHEFLIQLKRGKINKATQELLEIPNFVESFSRGIRDARAGRVKDWRKVRRDV